MRSLFAKRPARFVGVSLLALFLAGGFMVGPALWDIWRAGFFYKVSQRDYQGDSRSNLEAMYRALKLYHDSEEKFPGAEGWMEEVERRLRVYDMKPEETAKKMIRPDLWEASGRHGYALNEACAGKYIDDIEDASSTLLVFESQLESRDAAGDPDKVGLAPSGGKVLGVTATGEIIEFEPR